MTTRFYIRHVLISLFFVCSSFNLFAFKSNTVVIISSYPSDSKRVTDFLNEFDRVIEKKNYNMNFVMENMGFRGLNEIGEWRGMMKKIVDKYYNETNLKGIIILGQEAWTSYLSQDRILSVPFYGCFVSKNGILIPDSIKDNDYVNWYPQSINTCEYARKRGYSGGIMNHYNVEANVNLIRLLYPSVNSIAFISDNSYGGLSLQAHVKKIMGEKYPDIKLILLDGRKESVAYIQKSISTLDKNSAVLIGTWRIDNTGTFFMQGSIANLLPQNSVLPVFTITGVGIGDIAVGGYYPDYKINIGNIIDDIYRYNFEGKRSNPFYYTKNAYVFHKEKMEEFGIKSFQIPKESTIISKSDAQLLQYQKYLLYIIIILVIFITALVLAMMLYFKNKRFNIVLRAQQEELIKAKEEAEASDKLKSAFLANMSHEIRTPLNAIVGFSELMKDTHDEEEKDQYWQIIHTNSEMLLRLINDILDLSKIESGMIDLKAVKFDLSSLFYEIYSTQKHRHNDSKVDFIYDNPYKECIVDLDKNRITQIISNFVTNAFKFTPEGYIKIGYEYIDGGVKLYCEDSGIGIPVEKMEKVFARFHKLDSFAQGTGLGMAICKAIVDVYHGKIGVESVEGKGSKFYAWIPCHAQIEK